MFNLFLRVINTYYCVVLTDIVSIFRWLYQEHQLKLV